MKKDTKYRRKIYKKQKTELLGLSKKHAKSSNIDSQNKYTLKNTQEKSVVSIAQDIKPIASIAIMGRPNVGKSSLFNRINQKNIAITSHISGSTRDINKRDLKLNNFDITLIDTGGLEVLANKLNEFYKQTKKLNEVISETEDLHSINLSNPRKQALIAEQLKEYIAFHSYKVVNTSDIIIYMVDGSSIVLDDDIRIFRALSKQKPTLLVLNKVDSDKIALHASEFMAFGTPYITISVAHNRGITKLLSSIENMIQSLIDSKKIKQQKQVKKFDFLDYFDDTESILMLEDYKNIESNLESKLQDLENSYSNSNIKNSKIDSIDNSNNKAQYTMQEGEQTQNITSKANTKDINCNIKITKNGEILEHNDYKTKSNFCNSKHPSNHEQLYQNSKYSFINECVPSDNRNSSSNINCSNNCSSSNSKIYNSDKYIDNVIRHHETSNIIESLDSINPKIQYENIKETNPTKDFNEIENEKTTISVGIIGRPNVGKSSLLNALTNTNRSLVSSIAGTTIDPVDESIVYDGYKITFVDTAGIRKRGKIEGIEKYALDRTQKILKECDIALLVLDCSTDFVELDEKISSMASNNWLAIIVVFHKWDIRSREFDKQMEIYKRKFKFLEYAPVITASSTTNRHIKELKQKIIEVYKNFSFRISTAKLNDCIQNAIKKHPIPSDHGKLVKIYYATQFDSKPPKIALVMNRPNALHFSYKRYLVNTLRKNFGFIGTPIIVESRDKNTKENDC